MGRPRAGWRLRDPREPGDPYTVRFTNKAGRRVELTTGTSDPGEAASVAAELYARDLTSAGALVRSRVDPLLKLDEMLALYLADLLKTHDEKTVEQYARDAKRFVTAFGNSLANVVGARMADYQRTRLTQVLRSTVRKERSFFNQFLAWCVEQGVLGEADRPEWPKLPKKATGVRSGPQRAKPVDVTPEQVGAFLEALPLWSKARLGKKHAVRPRFIVAYETSLRPATLDGLELGRHWRLGQGYLEITDDIDKARFGRRVPISRLAQAALTYVVTELGLASGLIFGDHDYREQVSKAAETAKLPEGFAVYDLRHGRLGHLIDETGDVRAVMFLAGHLLMTTTNRYVRGQEASAQKAIETMAFRGDNGEREARMLSAKEGSRTLTGVTPPEPESGATNLDPSSSANVSGQGGTQRDREGQGSGDIPETQIPKSVADAAHFLAVLRASEAAMESAVLEEDDDVFQAWRDKVPGRLA